jgi:hypothetical protein
MQSELPGTPDVSTWSDQDREDGQQTENPTTKSPSCHSTTTSQPETPEEGSRGVATTEVSYVTSVAGEEVSDEDAAQFLNDLEDWYGDTPKT